MSKFEISGDEYCEDFRCTRCKTWLSHTSYDDEALSHFKTKCTCPKCNHVFDIICSKTWSYSAKSITPK